MERYGLLAVSCSYTNSIALVEFEGLTIFLCVFIRSFRVFVCKALKVNVPVAIFFLTVDSHNTPLLPPPPKKNGIGIVLDFSWGNFLFHVPGEIANTDFANFFFFFFGGGGGGKNIFFFFLVLGESYFLFIFFFFLFFYYFYFLSGF